MIATASMTSYIDVKNNNKSIEGMDQHSALMGALPPLDAEEVKELVRRWKATGHRPTFDRLVRSHMRFVGAVALHMQKSRPYLCIDDLIQEGLLGLMRGMETFDPDRGANLLTYAVWWIRQSIQSYACRTEHAVAMPNNMIHDRQTYGRAVRQVWKETPERNCDLTNQEIQDGLDRVLSEDRYRSIVALLVPDQSTDKEMPYGHNGIYAWGEKNLTDDAPPLLDTVVEEDHKAQIVAAVHKLDSARQQQILILYFGLEGKEVHTLEQIGEILTLTRERIRQIRNDALKLLKIKLKKMEVTL